MGVKQKNFIKNKNKITNYTSKSKWGYLWKPTLNNISLGNTYSIQPAINKLYFLNKSFYINHQYSNIPNICNKQGRFKKTFKHWFLNRHVLLKNLRGGSGKYSSNLLKKRIW